MANEKAPVVRVTLPAGKARWPQLDEPKKFRENGVEVGEPKYGIGVTYDEQTLAAVEKIVKDAWAKLAPPDFAKKLKDGVTPIKTPEKGEPYFSAKTGAKYKPPVFDAKVKKLPEGVKVGGGSLVKVDASIVWFKKSAKNFGLTAYLNGVQVLKLEEDTWGKPNFDEEEGYEHIDTTGASAFQPEDGQEMHDF